MKRIILPIFGVVGLGLIMFLVIRQINAAGDMIEQPLGPSKVTEKQSGILSGEEVISLIERLWMVQSDEKIYVLVTPEEKDKREALWCMLLELQFL